MLEVNTAILCASVPALKPIFTPQRMRAFRRRNQFHFHRQDDTSFKLDSQSNRGAFSRKPSNATLYPDLETFNLTKISASRSPPTSPTRPEDHNTQRPMSPRPESRDDEEAFDLPKQGAFHPV